MLDSMALPLRFDLWDINLFNNMTFREIIP